ncbi:hypothetical protein PTKIN_Ptkin09bG0207000 [Pterospermum kingtungense]
MQLRYRTRVQSFWCQLANALSIRKKGDIECIADDLIIEILRKLPAEDVFKCRRVCRRWRALTSSPQFIEEHLNTGCRSILLLQYPLERHLKFYFIDEKLKRKNTMSWSISTKYMPASRMAQVVDSCHGLLLFRCGYPNSNFFVCNPVTQEALILRQPYPEGSVIGIFFHSPTKEYRLLYTHHIQGNQNEFFIARIGSGTTYSWRRLGTTFGHKYFCTPPLIIGKCLYWIVSCYTIHPCADSILEFNIDSEEFKALPHPGTGCYFGGRCQITKFFSKMERDGAALCFVYDDKILVWVLKDHTKWSSWEKMYEVNLWALKKDLHMKIYCQFKIGNIENKELLILVSAENGLLIRYNLETKTIRKIRIRKCNDVLSSQFVVIIDYAKSLVSLKDLCAPHRKRSCEN